ncbi:LOW QUALITY PROTEIN: hypothetical protein CFC21_007428 [Triticum aestivum]|uniref:Cytochrome P450 n=2 Tax=Triticum aestivum TaxID=4565 RepID=A0A9R1DE43_WHEAT|nr:LOW QUALITY PROTEIN: hypothetical protein CFC21_007428 [Triticum aestivum]
MDLESSDLWLAIAILSITVALIGIARRRLTFNPVCTKSLPPMVNSITLLGQLPKLLMRGIQATTHDLYTKFGSVFTINLFGQKITFLTGPKVSAHFFQAPESEISQEVGFGVDSATRSEQIRFSVDALRPSKLRNHVDPMLQEVEGYFAKWGQEGIIDLKHELSQVLLLILGRCLLGKEIREKMLDDFYALSHDVENDLNLINLVFPYIPTAINHRRDRACSKLAEMLSEIDALQSLIHSKYKDGHSMTKSEVIGLIVALIFVGKHMSSQSSAGIGAYLLNDIKCLVAVVEEQKQIIKKHRDRIDYGVLLEMDTLHGCIKEALWLHPTTPVLIRKAHKHFMVDKEGNEYNIPAGHTLVMLGNAVISKNFLRSRKIYLGDA